MVDAVKTWSQPQTSVFDFVKTGHGNAIIEAVAGAGKTSTIIEALKYMKGYTYLAAFGKKMGAELKARIVGIDNVNAGTFHSYGFGLLIKAFKGVKLDNHKINDIVNDLIIRRADLAPYAEFCVTAVSMAKNRAIGHVCPIDDMGAWKVMIDQFDMMDSLPAFDDATIYRAIKMCIFVLKASIAQTAIIDFADMIYHVLMHKIKCFKHDYVIIDEAQDTNPARRALAKMMLKNTGRLIAVGDPHQAIFGFAGADNDSLSQIARDFNCITLRLSITYRCPKAIVKHAQNWVSHIEAADTAPDGVFDTARFDDITMPENYIKQRGLTKHKYHVSNMTGKDAILCRLNKPLVEMAFALLRQGIACKIEGKDIAKQLINLTKKWKVRSLSELRTKLSEYADIECAKALANKNEGRAEALRDRVDTLFVLMQKADEDGLNISGFQTMISNMFDDKVSEKGILTLCSVHKSKGLEWQRVFILGRADFMPSTMATQAWQMAQEINLIYVAITRAMHTLVEISM